MSGCRENESSTGNHSMDEILKFRTQKLSVVCLFYQLNFFGFLAPILKKQPGLVLCLQVPPEQFCDIMWAGDLHYKDHQCDFLAAYVAVCYTHQVCISWRRHNFCRKESER